MADSKHTMARIDRLERAFLQITDLLVLQGERLDHVSAGLDNLRDALTERLDRLIAVTTSERTVGIDRLANLEQRVSKLEQHVGV